MLGVEMSVCMCAFMGYGCKYMVWVPVVVLLGLASNEKKEKNEKKPAVDGGFHLNFLVSFTE